MLVACIVLYDAIHKVITISPILMASCRFVLYLVAASVAEGGVTGWAVWCGLALAFYIVGLSYVAARESTRGIVYYWPCMFLAVPIVLALLMNTGDSRKSAILLSAALALWVIRCLRFTFAAAERNVGRTVSGLLAGIVMVDLVAALDIDRPYGFVFVGLFLLSLLLQRFVPAT
jgi:4-hydroxybenzoate polyprenyltransferase